MSEPGEQSVDPDRPIRIYGLSPTGQGPRTARGCVTSAGMGMIAFWGLSMLVSRLFPALEEYAKGLPWYRPELAWLGLAVFLVAVVIAVIRIRRVQLVRGVRVDLYPDRLRIEQGGQVHVFAPAELKGFSAEASDAVVVTDEGDRQFMIPTPNEAVRVLVLDWLAGREVHYLGDDS
ncbi:MAG: hypothetical protein JKY65_12305 [Planctomycetes bacterium]|nr:hypothetical protein [Planctomycetota bacterium]